MGPQEGIKTGGKPQREETRPRRHPETAQEPDRPPVSGCDDLRLLIAKRAYELHWERGCREGYALDDWLEAEREVLSQVPPI